MQIYESIRSILGLNLEPKDLGFFQVSLRAIIVFIVSLAIVRIANKRFLSKMTAFDAILGFIMGSMLARAVNGSAAFFPTLGAGFVLVGLHAMLAMFSFHSSKFESLVKGESRPVVQDGKIIRGVLAKAMLSEKDLLEEARLNGKIKELKDVQLATLERNGQVSIVPKE
jgi:uncharacterized membrane protein YcaP (DUF421 family)